MKIEVSLSPALYPYRTVKEHHVTVAVDLLRASTAVCAAFQAGCDAVLPLDTLDGIASYRDHGYLLAAERGGAKVNVSYPDGTVTPADYGNSPTEYLRHDLSGVKLAYSTTNGTVSILKSADAELSLVGCFANISALADRLRQENKDVVVLCSGWQNDFCIEDTLVAGALQEMLAPGFEPCGDAANMALSLWREAKADPFGYCQKATHVHRLYGLGAEEDVRFAFQMDTCPVVPVLKNSLLTL
jgi:2-phosphosulfolactate phosphatase